MNIRMYNEFVGWAGSLTDPLWELYGLYNGYSDAPLSGALLLGLIASFYPGQVAQHMTGITVLTFQMTQVSHWLKSVFGFFIGKLAGVYLAMIFYFWLGNERANMLLEQAGIFSIVIYLILGIYLITSVIRKENDATYQVESKPVPFVQVFIIGLLLAVLVDSQVFALVKLMLPPWLITYPLYGWLFPFFFTLAAFIPVWVFSILAYGFNVDIFFKKHAARKPLHYFLGAVFIVLAINQLLFYWP